MTTRKRSIVRTLLASAGLMAIAASGALAQTQGDTPTSPLDPSLMMRPGAGGAGSSSSPLGGGGSTGGLPDSNGLSVPDQGTSVPGGPDNAPDTGIPYPSRPPAPLTSDSDTGGGSSFGQRPPPVPYTTRPGTGSGGSSTGGIFRQPSAPDPRNPTGSPPPLGSIPSPGSGTSGQSR